MENLQVLFEDNQIIVAIKPQNMPSQEDITKDEDILTAIKAYLKEKYQKPGNVYLGLVHRLDRPTGGIMVFAKTSKAAERLSEQIRNGDMDKKYLAVVCGEVKEEQAKLVHYLKKNAITNNVFVVPSATEGAKRAELDYKLLEKINGYSLIEVELVTGRGHQIRVQMATIGHPIVGDAKYGSKDKVKLALWAFSLAFEHPVSKERMVFIAYPPEEKAWQAFKIDTHLRLK